MFQLWLFACAIVSQSYAYSECKQTTLTARVSHVPSRTTRFQLDRRCYNGCNLPSCRPLLSGLKDGKQVSSSYWFLSDKVIALKFTFLPFVTIHELPLIDEKKRFWAVHVSCFISYSQVMYHLFDSSTCMRIQPGVKFCIDLFMYMGTGPNVDWIWRTLIVLTRRFLLFCNLILSLTGGQHL